MSRAELSMHPWHHYVAIGDSFTRGAGAPVEGFTMLGTSDRLAAALRRSNPEFCYTNLTEPHLTVSEIRARQLDAAVQLQPDLVSIVAGANDIMTGRFSVAGWEAEFRAFFEAFAGTGATVMIGTLPDFPILRTLKEPLQLRLKNNFVRGNDVIRRLAAEHGAILIDAWVLLARYDAADWSADGVHPNARGYFKFAQEVIAILEQQAGVEIGRAIE